MFVAHYKINEKLDSTDKLSLLHKPLVNLQVSPLLLKKMGTLRSYNIYHTFNHSVNLIDATVGLVKYFSIDESAYKIVKQIMSTLSHLLSFYLCLQLILSFCVLSYQWNWVLIKWTLLVLLAVPIQRSLLCFT